MMLYEKCEGTVLKKNLLQDQNYEPSGGILAIYENNPNDTEKKNVFQAN